MPRLDRITGALTQIGLELEGIEDRGATLASFRVAHVIEAVPHPNADRLQGVQGRYRRWHRLGGLRRPECAHRNEGGLCPRRQLSSRAPEPR